VEITVLGGILLTSFLVPILLNKLSRSEKDDSREGVSSEEFN
jgi:hypothetical protein